MTSLSQRKAEIFTLEFQLLEFHTHVVHLPASMWELIFYLFGSDMHHSWGTFALHSWGNWNPDRWYDIPQTYTQSFHFEQDDMLSIPCSTCFSSPKHRVCRTGTQGTRYHGINDTWGNIEYLKLLWACNRVYSKWPKWLVFFFFLFKAGSHYVTLAGQELSM